LGGINTENRLQTTRDLADGVVVAPHNTNAALVEANEAKFVYKITFDLPDGGLGPNLVPGNLIV
jgi:hypothetical protein